MKNMTKTLAAATACLMLILLSTGCAGLLSTFSKPVPLEERVKGFMRAQMDGKWDVAYTYLDAASRKKTPEDSYLHQIRKASYKSYEIEEITEMPSGDQAKVKLRLDISFMGYDLKRAPYTQSWVKEKGAWYVDTLPQHGNPFTDTDKKKGSSPD